MGLFGDVFDAFSGISSKKSIERDQKKLDDWGRDSHRTLGQNDGFEYESDQLDRTEDEIKNYQKELKEDRKKLEDW